MKRQSLSLSVSAFLIVLFLAPGKLAAATALGDWGHFISYNAKMYLYNPDGRDFDVTAHVLQWPIDWNKPDQQLKITAPDDTVVVNGRHKLEKAEATVRVTDAQKGVYLVESKGHKWISSTLDRSVLHTGETQGHMVDDRRAVFQCTVPRRWWFWVPRDVTEFTVKAQRADRYMSQREDWGFFVISPRGQRMKALWGQPPHKGQYRQEQTRTVEVEPGAAGRFWSLEVQYADSHVYSNINITFDGVPRYLARSPEEWFNPKTANIPQPKIYDATPFIQSARIEEILKEKWPALHHFSPCPSLGDPDGIKILGDATFALWNPDGRDLQFRIGTYLPRKGKENPEMAHVVITGPDGDKVLDKELPMLHLHGKGGNPTEKLAMDKGVSVVEVSGVEKFMSFTYPATPLVLYGKEQDDGWAKYRLTAAAPRNWYFYVPKGIASFQVSVAADFETDVVDMQVCSPDRIANRIYGHEGQSTIQVPEGMDGKMWYLRPSVGSASRMITREKPYRYQDMPLTIRMKGVPGYLSPTWGQWFDPEKPVAPMVR